MDRSVAADITTEGLAGGSRERAWIDRVFLAVVFLIPFIPRPTIDHPARFLAPAVIAALLYFYVIWFLAKKSRTRMHGDKTLVLGFILVFVLLVYLARILVNGEWDELPHFTGRALASFLMVAFLGWMNKRGMTLKEVYRPLFYGSLILGALVIFIGFTGIPLFGPDSVRPPRTYGFTFPFYRTGAIPRSYGEFNIIMSAAWAYFLVHGKDYKTKLRWGMGAVLMLAIIISQSRSTYLGIVMVTTGYFMLRHRATKRLVMALVAAALFMPIILSVIPKDLPVVKSIVGESTYAANVSTRFNQYDAAIDIIGTQPGVVFLGVRHSEWASLTHGVEGEEEALHNHFLSMLIFMGLVGGVANLLVYLLPVLNLVRARDYSGSDVSMIIIATSGMLIGLNFYEGFFSMIAALNIAALWYSYRIVKSGDRHAHAV